MIDALPRRAFFRFELPIRYLRRPPRVSGTARDWSAEYLVPPLITLEGREPFVDVYWGWCEEGFYAAFDVPNRFRRPICDPKAWWQGDGIRLCLATREPRDVRRGTRFCHFFYLLPLGGGRDGDQPIVGWHRMSHAKEHPPAVDLSRIQVAARVSQNRYSLEVAIPAACLHGWDPTEHPRIGVFYKVKDAGHRSQHLSTTDELGWNTDPSTWATGVLVR